MDSVFSKIIRREIPAYIVAEDDDFIAFLDIHPLNIGHTLVVPKKEVDYLFDIDDDYLRSYIVFVKRVAIKIKKAIPCSRVGMSVLGFDIPHAHIHLVPINTTEDMNFSRAPLSISDNEMREIQQRISKA